VNFDPVLRLERVLRVLVATGGIETTDSVADLWDVWDGSTNVKGWRECVTEMRDRTARSYSRYVKVSEQPDEHATSIVRVLEAYVADQVAATNLLLNDPDGYVNTRQYVETTSDTLPTPLLSVELGEFLAPLDTFPINDAVRLPRIVDRDGLRGWNRAVIDAHHPPRPLLLDAALDYEFICKLCDVAFSDEALDAIDKETLLKSLASSTGLVPLFVF
jgi:hypothetical protein